MNNKHSESLITKFKNVLIGEARNVRDPMLFHQLSLAALLAWVGLGADGLSSSCYGPEEAFRMLEGHSYLSIFVAIAMGFTIFIITAGYSQVVELFPGGGGGYLVASKLLSPVLGMVSGCALLIDYLLTITISIASGADAICSFLPKEWLPYDKIALSMAGVIVLTVLNLRGVRESVVPLVPIFLVFLATHVFALLYSVFSHFNSLEGIAASTAKDVGNAVNELGLAGVLILVLRSYSLGAGTYTGIEAVSNAIPILREPRVETARKTLRYMAGSLAFMAMGLMIGYLIFNVKGEEGKTYNAVFMESLTQGWGVTGYAFVFVTLLSEAVLLFVAAQSGFLGGPRVLANMSMDRWFPQQFSLLSERLVIKNGILIMGGGAIILMIATGGSVRFLVVLYAINVFITFCLSQAGMVRHWWMERKKVKTWKRKLFINGIGLVLSVFILVSQLILKFGEGGWITIFLTGSLILTAAIIKRFYNKTHKMLKRLDQLTEVVSVPSAETRKPAPRFRKRSKTAVILVSGFNGMGLHTFFNVKRIFGNTFNNFIFMQAGVIDADRFKGKDELTRLSEHVQSGLNLYVEYVRSLGFHADSASAMGTDVAFEISNLSRRLFKKIPESVFFGGQIVFEEETTLSKLLFNHTTFAVQRHLHQSGIPFIIMPVRVKQALRMA